MEPIKAILSEVVKSHLQSKKIEDKREKREPILESCENCAGHGYECLCNEEV